MSFKEFFSKEIMHGIKRAGFKSPSPIQKETIPLILEGIDLIAQAHTGTGKTAAFGLPILQKLSSGEIERALIITPTRELAVQVSDELYYLGKYASIKTLAVFGGVGYGRQIGLINKGVEVVVATPGRLLDLLKKELLHDFNPEVVVLDEADEMLNMGFLEDVQEIFSYIPQNRQTLLFSATIPKEIQDLAQKLLYKPKFVSVINENEATVKNEIKQSYFLLEETQKDRVLLKLLQEIIYKKTLLFCRTKKEVERVYEFLLEKNFEVFRLHGDIKQQERQEIIKNFKRAKKAILVATDVAARGLDIKGITHVINYHIPLDSQSYVHRIGRTGRAKAKGEAITFVTPLEFRELERIKKEVGAKLVFETMQGKMELNDLKEEILTQKECENNEILELFNNLDKDILIKKLLSFIVKKCEKSELSYSQQESKKLFNLYLKEKKEKR